MLVFYCVECIFVVWCGVVWCVVGSVVFNKCGGGGKWVRVILGPDPHISL